MRHAVVTGASSGIGEAIARELAAHGYALTLVARRRDRLTALAAELQVPTHVVVADLADRAQATSWLAAAEEKLGPVEVLINNAGVQTIARTPEVPANEALGLLEVDLITPLQLISAVIPGMITRRSGAVVQIASVAALASTPGMVHYNAAKSGLAAASESLRAELAVHGVHVCTVYPGPVHTPMGDAGYEAVPSTFVVRLLPIGRADVLARRVRRAIDRRLPRIIYPRLYHLTRYFPTIVRRFVDASTPLPKARPPRALSAS